MDIPSSVAGNLATSILTNFCGGNSCFVSTFYDQSGNGRDAPQANTTKQLSIVNGGVINTYNSRPIGVIMNSNEVYQTTSFSPGGATTYTMNMVVPNSGGHLKAMTYSADTSMEWQRWNGDNLSYPMLGRTTRTSFNAGIPATGPVIITQINDGTNHLIYRSGTLGGSAAVAGANDTSSRVLTLGSANGATSIGVRLGEWILFLSQLPTANRQTLERNQGDYYGISVL